MPSDGVPGGPRRVLIVRPSALGDVIRTVPALVTLRRALPDAAIDWLVQESFIDAVAHHPGLSGVIPFPRDRFGGMLTRPAVALEAARWTGALRRRRYDVAVDLQGLSRSGLFTWLTRAPVRVGFANATEGAWVAYNRRHHVDSRLHAVDRMLALLEAAGYPPCRDLRLHLGAHDARWLSTFLAENGCVDEPYVAMAPTARWRCKCWPIDHFVEVALRLLATGRAGARVVVLAAPAERPFIRPLLDALGPRGLAPLTTVGQMLALVSRARLLVANDSAPLHAAVGFGRPLVAVFGPTDPFLVGPCDRADAVVRAPGARPGPIGQYRRHRHDQTLIAQVTVDRVWTRIERELAATAG